MTRPVRVLAFPDRHGNPYLDLFYRALEPYGIRVTFTERIDRELAASELEFDVIHFHWSLHAIWRRLASRRGSRLRALLEWRTLLRALKRRGVRIVWTAHELFPPDDGRWTDALGYALCARAADLCICHNSLARRQLTRRFGVRQRKILSLPIGTYAGVLPAPRERAITDERFGLPRDARLLVCFGDLRPRKGVEVALRAAPLLGDDYVLVVAGDVPNPMLRPWAERLQRTSSASNVRIVLQRLDSQALADLLGAADCVVLPYLHIVGSSALSLSLASGRGVVASALPYFSEVLSLEPDAGVLAKPGDPEALVRAVHEFFARPTAERHGAARRLGAQLTWANLVPPVAQWLIGHARPLTPPSAMRR